MNPRKPSSLWTNVPLVLWNGLLVALSPYLLLDKGRRFLRRRNADDVNPDRWNRSAMSPNFHEELATKVGPHVVFVGASYGELVIMRQLTEALQRRVPNAKISWTIRDKQTIQHVLDNENSPPVALWPFDFILPVQRYLNEVKPDVLVLTERFRFPTFVNGADHSGAKVVLINGRYRPRKTFLYRVFRPYYQWMVRSLSTMLMQSEEHQNAIQELASPSSVVSITGDIKLDLRQGVLDAERSQLLRDWIQPDHANPLLIAGSTDSADEERFVLKSFSLTRESHSVRLMIAPRRTQRRDELVAIAEEMGLKVSLRSAVTPDPDADVLILDTLGELAVAYQYGLGAYVGGSFDGMGHNVTEPIAWDVPVAYGMRRGHFGVLQQLCEDHGVGFRVAESADLSAFWNRVLLADELAVLREKCSRLASSQSGSFQATLDGIQASIQSCTYVTPQFAVASVANSMPSNSNNEVQSVNL